MASDVNPKDAVAKWREREGSLVDQVEAWLKELAWSTRRIMKRMHDPSVGHYEVPAVLMQKELTKILLEPITASAPGAEGVLDLYLLPAYDDIASIYYYDGGWQLHYMPHSKAPVATVRQADAKPLSKESLSKVLEEMKEYADQ